MLGDNKYIFGDDVRKHCGINSDREPSIATIGYGAFPKTVATAYLDISSVNSFDELDRRLGRLQEYNSSYLEIKIHTKDSGEQRKFAETLPTFLITNFSLTKIHILDNPFDKEINDKIKGLLARNRQFYRHKSIVLALAAIAPIAIAAVTLLALPSLLICAGLVSLFSIWYVWTKEKRHFKFHLPDQEPPGIVVSLFTFPVILSSFLKRASGLAFLAGLTGFAIDRLRTAAIENSIRKYGVTEEKLTTPEEIDSFRKGLETRKGFMPSWSLATWKCPRAYYAGNHCPLEPENEKESKIREMKY